MKPDSSAAPGLLQNLQGNASFARALVEGTPTGILVVDRECRIVDLNHKMREWIRKPKDALIGRKCHEAIFLSDQPCPLTPHGCPARHAVATREPSPKILRSRQAPDSGRMDLEIQAFPILDEAGKVLYALEFLHDVTAGVLLKKYREEALLRDSLTDLYNRKAFHIFLERELKRAGRQRHPFCLALVDLDSFKDYNEKRGDEAGDALLQQLGQLLVATTRREVDTVFRLEGDRFALTLPEANQEQARTIGERLRQAEREKGLPVTFSLAICQARESEAASSLAHRVEEELFRAKKGEGTRIL